MIGTYIKELLKKHNRVIVPDLGAFLKKNDNPDLLYFNEFLRFNDGLLVDYLAEKENVDKIEAAKRIKNFVADITAKLKEKQSVDLTDVGTLYLDNTEKIQLKIDLLKVYVPDESTENITPKKEKAPKIKEDKKTQEPPVAEIKNTEVIPENKEPIAKPLVEKIETPVKEETKTPEDKTVKSMNNAIPQDPKKRETIIKAPAYVEKKKTGKSLLWIILIVLLAAALVLLWIYIIKPKYFDKSKQDASVKNDTRVVISGPATDSTKSTDTKKPAVIVKTKTAKMYYLVVGCFAMESNADKLIQSLKQKGFDAEKFAKIDEMYFVSIASFSDKGQAQSEMNKLNAQGYECWLKAY